MYFFNQVLFYTMGISELPVADLLCCIEILIIHSVNIIFLYETINHMYSIKSISLVWAVKGCQNQKIIQLPSFKHVFLIWEQAGNKHTPGYSSRNKASSYSSSFWPLVLSKHLQPLHEFGKLQRCLRGPGCLAAFSLSAAINTSVPAGRRRFSVTF